MRKTLPLVTALAGLALLAWLISRQDMALLGRALSAVGWGFVFILLLRLPVHLLDALGWRRLFPARRVPSIWLLVRARWVAESFNTLLPVAQVGGHILRAQMLARRGAAVRDAAASVLVDFTLGTSTQVVFAFMGALLLLPRAGDDGARVLVMVLVFGLGVAGFVVVQRAGVLGKATGALGGALGRKAGPAGKLGAGLAGLAEGGESFNARVTQLYAARRTLAVSACWRLAAWINRSLETWFALSLMGQAVSVGDALVLESLSTAAGMMLFLVPGALGVREAALVLIGGMLGVPAADCLALGLIKRARELVLGAPGIASWLLLDARAAKER